MALCIKDCRYFGKVIETLGWLSECVRIVSEGEKKRLMKLSECTN